MVGAHAHCGQPAGGGHCPGVFVGFPALDEQRNPREYLPLHFVSDFAQQPWLPWLLAQTATPQRGV